MSAAAIVTTEDTLSGTARFAGTRLGLVIVLDMLLAHGGDPDAVERAYPTLPDGWRELVGELRPVLRSEYRRVIPKHGWPS